VRAGFAFDIPARFDTDTLMTTLESCGVGSAPEEIDDVVENGIPFEASNKVTLGTQLSVMNIRKQEDSLSGMKSIMKSCR
jgi:hypothetical protein